MMPQQPVQHPHHQRLRKSSRTQSWILLPLSVAAGALWIVVTAVVCGNERLTSRYAIGFCRWTQVIPDSAALLLVVNFGLIAWTLVDLERITNPRQRSAGESLVTHYARTSHHAYSSLDDEHRRLVRGSIEASAWASVLMLALLMFYWFEFTVPLGVLAIAGTIRGVYTGLRHVMRTTSQSRSTAS